MINVLLNGQMQLSWIRLFNLAFSNTCPYQNSDRYGKAVALVGRGSCKLAGVTKRVLLTLLPKSWHDSVPQAKFSTFLLSYIPFLKIQRIQPVSRKFYSILGVWEDLLVDQLCSRSVVDSVNDLASVHLLLHLSVCLWVRLRVKQV